MNNISGKITSVSKNDKPSRIRVLVVDDDEDIQFLLKQGVEFAGYECSTSGSANEALLLLEKQEYAVVVSDINMPGISGLELIKIVKEKYSADLMIITGYSENFTYEEIIGMGAGDFLQKPVRIEEFIARLKRLLTERKIIKELNSATEELKKNLESFKKAFEGFVQAISVVVEMRDPYTAGHQQRVAQLACAIAEEMNLPADTIYGLRMACVLHDIGKIIVPAEILNRPGELTDLEYGIIKNHAKAGHDILAKIEFSWPLAEIVFQHHERMDGSGYPRGLKGADIILEARILAVADVFETMISHRPYRPSLGLSKAIEEISSNKGKLYDSRVADACLKLFIDKNFTFQ